MDPKLTAILRDYELALEDLTFNSKPLINNLTMAADKYKPIASKIIEKIEKRLFQVAAVFYLHTNWLWSKIIFVMPWFFKIICACIFSLLLFFVQYSLLCTNMWEKCYHWVSSMGKIRPLLNLLNCCPLFSVSLMCFNIRLATVFILYY